MRRFSWPVLAPTLAVSALLLVLGTAAAWYAHRMNKDVSESLSANISSVLASERLVLDVRDVRLDLDRLADTGDDSHLAAAVAARREIERSLDEVERTNEAEGARALYELTRDGYDQFVAELDELHGTAPGVERRERAHEVKLFLATKVVAPAEELLELDRNAAHTSGQRNQEVATRVGLGLLLLGVCGAVAGVLVGYVLSRSVHRSVMQLSLPVRDIAGRLNELVGPITVSSEGDLTELEAALRMLADKTTDVVRQFQDQQEQSQRAEQLAAVGQLAAGLAHEIRNPLMSMKLLVQAAIEREEPDSRRARDLSILEEEIVRLEDLLQTFLDFARPPRPNVEPLDVARLIETPVQVVQPRAGQQQVEIHCETPKSALTIHADRAQLRQLLLNLLLNALDVLPGGGNIWVKVEQVAELPEGPTASPPCENADNGDGQIANLSYVRIQVADDGPGLSDNVERIFDPFVSTKVTGIGLGLSICQRIAEAHGGRITATNRDETGAAFAVSLPATPSLDRDEGSAAGGA